MQGFIYNNFLPKLLMSKYVKLFFLENRPEPLNRAESIEDPLSEDLSYSSSSDSFPSSSVLIILGRLKTGLLVCDSSSGSSSEDEDFAMTSSFSSRPTTSGDPKGFPKWRLYSSSKLNLGWSL